MLRELHISGLGVIDDLDLELHPGLNVLSGETGAGKTLVTVGIALALGARGASSLVRSGHASARVQARFDAPTDDLGWAEDGEVLLARTVGADGRSSARIGGQLARGLRILLVGVLILGFAHLFETALFVLLNANTQINEIIHRLLIATAFVFVILGFWIMRRAFEE